MAEEQRMRGNGRRRVRVMTHHPRSLNGSVSAKATTHVASVQDRSIFVPIFQENFSVVRMRRKEIPKRDTTGSKHARTRPKRREGERQKNATPPRCENVSDYL